MNWIIEKLVSFDNDIFVKNDEYTYGDLVENILLKSDLPQINIIDNKCTPENIAIIISCGLQNKTVMFKNDDVDISEFDKSTLAKLNGDAGLIVFTSGTTGKPKAILHNLTKILESYKDIRRKKDNFLLFLMFDHMGGLNTLFNIMFSGASMTIPDNRNPHYICSLIERYKVNVLPSTPSFINLMLLSGAYEEYDLSSLSLITYGTEVMPESVLAKLRKELPNVKLIETFGTSEVGVVKTTSNNGMIKIINADYKLVDGELLVKSDNVSLGYLNASNERFTDDGWYVTGDLAIEENGYIKIVGRKSEMINVGGEKVLPSEVENVVLQMLEIKDCVAYPVKNPLLGNVVGIDVVTDHEDIKVKIMQYCKDKIAKYKIPVVVNIVDKIGTNDIKKRRRH